MLFVATAAAAAWAFVNKTQNQQEQQEHKRAFIIVALSQFSHELPHTVLSLLI
jgi:hypothetical protein